jgi:hypothetical protein
MKNITFILMILIVVSCKQTTKEKVNDKSKIKTDSVANHKTKESNDSIPKHQTFNEAVDDLNENLKSFVPKDYSAISIASGNLNLDEFKDVILVLRKNTEETTSNMDGDKPDKRPLLILLGQKEASYKLAYKNENAVLCIDCGGVFGDPFTGITIKNGYFSIEHGVSGGHHWEDITTFKYDKIKSNWYLYKDHYVGYKLNDSEDENADALIVDSEKLQTVKDFGEISFQKFNIYSDKGY